ncbi:unnamed protein product [Moneuplotes crassus]|uniref:Uncharacterized protein n=2 Tax=Euplotes crassus TaxID=5936 RepID=A0AAD1UJF3_EUPCR|nr:unnamed protein product [Moneuplotes crassus]|eukprot:CAMPEP_0197007628 /NCGR_PEP_ID=MMETSP1380-20130617/41596_1 /TAXON_ID=5936 /ORGANISM="Euplotes crassus, Strain CT5" /LENGTH=130 /DNA_ID=CAMNT_0042427833 /DNA_START=54 /DNA_END=446 /DNA_ORIENTATION=-
MAIEELWDDSDLTVSEETSNNMPRQTLNKTRQFDNTMKNNKGKIKSEDLSDYVLKKKSLHHHSSLLDIPIQSFGEEEKRNCEQEEKEEKFLKPAFIRANIEGTASTTKEGAQILSNLRRISSSELLKVIL